MIGDEGKVIGDDSFKLLVLCGSPPSPTQACQ